MVLQSCSLQLPDRCTCWNRRIRCLSVVLWSGPLAAAGTAGVSFTSDPLMALCAQYWNLKKLELMPDGELQICWACAAASGRRILFLQLITKRRNYCYLFICVRMLIVWFLYCYVIFFFSLWRSLSAVVHLHQAVCRYLLKTGIGCTSGPKFATRSSNAMQTCPADTFP